MENNTRVGALDEVTSSPALVLESFLTKLREEIPELKYVYDEKLSYETSVKAFRAQNNMNKTDQRDGNDKSDYYPMFAFNRSVLRYPEQTSGPGKRLSAANKVRQDVKDTKDRSVEIYRIVQAEFDLRFLWITKSIKDLERFEILYLSEEGISSYKEVEVDLGSDKLEKFKYFFEYGPLEDKLFEYEGNYYKTLSSTIKVRGMYPVLRGEAKIIREINMKILDAQSAILVSSKIT
jgi:hypothetical protein